VHESIVGRMDRNGGLATVVSAPGDGTEVELVLGSPAAAEPATRIDPELDSLTAREHEILLLIARGYTYKEIAARLHLSVKTIETHVSSVLRKLQLTNRNELTRWAAQRRMI